jgi:hypothetical protein
MMQAQGRPVPRGIDVVADTGEWAVPVLFGVDAASKAAAEAYAVSHNNLVLSGGDMTAFDMARLWDAERYMGLLTELAEAGELPESVDGDDLDALLAGLVEQEPVEDPGAQIDKAAELQEKWQVERGQIFQVGRHLVMCGDSTCSEDVKKLTGGVVVNYGIHDPPYGIKIDTAWLSALNVKRGKPPNVSDDRLRGDDGTLDISCAFDFGKWLVWGFPYLAQPSMTGWLVWDKWPGADGGLGNPVEMACTNMWNGFRLLRVMWGGYYRAAGESREPHPTQKPIGIIKPIIEDCTKQGDAIADLFCGSGTTLVACEQTGRIGYGMEIEPKYVAVTLERLSGMGLEPHLVEQ